MPVPDDPGGATSGASPPKRSSPASSPRRDDDPFDQDAPRLGRLPAPRRSELDAARMSLYDEITGGVRASGAFPLVDEEGRLQGPFAAMLANPLVGDALQRLGTTVRTATVLAEREREIAILEVARSEGSEYEWWAHVRVARSIGFTDDELSALESGDADGTFSGREAVVRRVSATLCQNGDLDDALFEAAVAALGRVALADLVHLVGYYRLLALSLAVWRIPLPGDEAPSRDCATPSAPRP